MEHQLEFFERAEMRKSYKGCRVLHITGRLGTITNEGIALYGDGSKKVISVEVKMDDGGLMLLGIDAFKSKFELVDPKKEVT
jgi:hypothetical protein